MHTKRVNYNWNVYVLYTDIICTNVGYKNLQNAIGFGGENVQDFQLVFDSTSEDHIACSHMTRFKNGVTMVTHASVMYP